MILKLFRVVFALFFLVVGYAAVRVLMDDARVDEHLAALWLIVISVFAILWACHDPVRR